MTQPLYLTRLLQKTAARKEEPAWDPAMEVDLTPAEQARFDRAAAEEARRGGYAGGLIGAGAGALMGGAGAAAWGRSRGHGLGRVVGEGALGALGGAAAGFFEGDVAGGAVGGLSMYADRDSKPNLRDQYGFGAALPAGFAGGLMGAGAGAVGAHELLRGAPARILVPATLVGGGLGALAGGALSGLSGYGAGYGLGLVREGMDAATGSRPPANPLEGIDTVARERAVEEYLANGGKEASAAPVYLNRLLRRL